MPAQPAYRADVAPFSGEIAGLLYDGLQPPRSATLRLEAGVVTDISNINDITDTGDVGSRDLTTTSEPLIVPGFVDLHNHGGAGGGFPNGTVEECIEAALYHRQRGTTTLWASLVSAPGAELIAQTKLLAGLAEQGLIAGIHMEGPFISACRCGAQNPAHIIDGDPQLFADVIDAGRGFLKAITFAPETPNVDALFELCASHNIIASLGHTDADFTTMAEAIARGRAVGATVTATHLFNAMPQIHHRDPGAVAALLSAGARGEAGLEVIGDGVHLDDGTVDMVYNIAPDRAFAITDAMAAAGKADGSYVLGALDVTVSDGVARLTDGGAIAGGTSTLAEQFARRVARESSIEEASAFVTRNAAAIAGVPGTISRGDDGNLVVFSRLGDQTPALTIAAGCAYYPK